MKKRIYLFLSLVLAVFMSALALVSCNKEETVKNASITKTTETMIVVEVKTAEEEQTLLDVLNVLAKDKQLSFESETGTYGEFITTINGKKAVGNDFWALYTSDTANSNAEWGEIEVDGKKYASASFGVSGLKVIANGVYVLAYTDIPDNAVVTSATEDQIVITVNTALENQTLLDVLNTLKTDGKLSFESETGPYGEFITSVNGKVAEENKNFWAIYTTDTENSNAEFGTIEINGTTLNSASFGVSGLMVKSGASYAFVFTNL